MQRVGAYAHLGGIVELPSRAPTMCEHKSGVCEEPVREIRNLTWSSSSKAEAIAAILVLLDRGYADFR